MPSFVIILLNSLILSGAALGEVCKCVSLGVFRRATRQLLPPPPTPAAVLCSNSGVRLPRTHVGRRRQNGTHSMIPSPADLFAPSHLHPPAILVPSPTTTRSPAAASSPTGRPGSFTQPTRQALRLSRAVSRYTLTGRASMVILMLGRRVALSAPCPLMLSTRQARETFSRRLRSQKRTTSGSTSRVLDIAVLQGE